MILGIAKSQMAFMIRRKESSSFFPIVRQKVNCYVPLLRMQLGYRDHHTATRTKLLSAKALDPVAMSFSVGRGPLMIDCIHNSSATFHRMFSVQSFIKKTEQQRQKQEKEKSDKKKEIEISKRITALAKEQKWKEILQLYRDRKDSFTAVCHSTLISQLRRIRSHKKEDPLFLAYLEDLSGILRSRGVMWMDARSVATIVHGIAAMGLQSNQSAMQIVALIDKGNNPEWLFDTGNLQEVANCVWACGRLGIQSPNVFRLLDRNAERLFETGNSQNVAN